MSVRPTRTFVTFSYAVRLMHYCPKIVARSSCPQLLESSPLVITRTTSLISQTIMKKILPPVLLSRASFMTSRGMMMSLLSRQILLFNDLFRSLTRVIVPVRYKRPLVEVTWCQKQYQQRHSQLLLGIPQTPFPRSLSLLDKAPSARP